MACNSRSSCGPDFEQMRLWLKGIILELLNDGTLQAGLKDCEGEWLGKGRGVVLCDALADLLCDLINEGKLCVPKIAGFTADCDTKTLTITMADGTELTADASCFGGSGSAADGNTKIKSFTYDPQTGVVKIVDTENREFEVTISTKNTTNKAMAWEPAKQEVSITDTDDNKVSTVVTFPVIERPPVSQGTAPTQFIGKSGALFLGEPAVWMRMLLPDGRVGRLPVFLEDVSVVKCTPYQHVAPESGMPTNILVHNNVYKAGDSYSVWAARNNNLPMSSISYAPDQTPASAWKEFAKNIYDWLEANEGPGINANDYEVAVPVVGYVKLGELMDLDNGGAYGVMKYFHAFSVDDQMKVYALESAGSVGIGSDGNIYIPAEARCGFTRTPSQEPEQKMWVSITYASNQSGQIVNFYESDKRYLDVFPQQFARSRTFFSDIIDIAEDIRAEEASKAPENQGLRWSRYWGDLSTTGRFYRDPFIVLVNTPFGSFHVEDIDFEQLGEHDDAVEYVKKPKALENGTFGEEDRAGKLFFYKTDEIELVPGQNGFWQQGKINLDNASKNLIALYSHASGASLQYTFTAELPGLALSQVYFGPTS